jgi:DNA-binding transcriptional ArsR family regulator
VAEEPGVTTRRGLNAPSRFSPGNCTPEVLEAILVGRGRLLDRLLRSVKDQVALGAGRHHLLLGPRGAGKTHLIALLNHRLQSDAEINRQILVAWLREEERGVGSMVEFVLRILEALHRHGAIEPKTHARIDAVYDLRSDRLLPGALALLNELLEGRRLVVLVENLGMLLSRKEGFGKSGQQALRDVLQSGASWTLLATAQSIPVDIEGEDGPLAGSFLRHPLAPFDADQAWLLLDKVAELEGRPDLREFIATAAGRGRVRAIHELCGGNPRLLVVFFQFVDRQSLTDFAGHFLERTALLTSYYQERMNGRSTLEQKIVQVLCAHRTPMGVQAVARACLTTPGSVSKQLSLLKDAGIVAPIPQGRSTLYELREPLMRIAFEVKENLGFPVGLFVEFLARFYGRRELEARRSALAPNGAEDQVPWSLDRHWLLWREGSDELHTEAAGLAVELVLRTCRFDPDVLPRARALLNRVEQRGWLPPDDPGLRIAFAGLALLEGDTLPALGLVREERRVLAELVDRPVPGVS